MLKLSLKRLLHLAIPKAYMNQPIDRKYMTKLTVEDFSKIFRNKKDLYE
jgi:hypothetical protein